MARCGRCPGLFKGSVPLPLPLPCDMVHLALGMAAGAVADPDWRGLAAALYVLYQALEELTLGDWRSFTKDVAVFAAGFLTGWAVRWRRQHPL